MSITFVENDKNLSDDEVIGQIKSGDYELFRIIIDRYYPIIVYYIKKYNLADYGEDVVQEATLSLYTAVKDYDASKSSFATFATLCVKRAVISVLKGMKRKKNIPDDLLLSIETAEIADENSPEKIFFEREDYKNLTDSIKLELSALEYEVLQLYLSGEKYIDISKKLNITEKSVDNSLARIRKKLKGK